MSRLFHSLHALPPGSYVTTQMMRAERDLNNLLHQQGQREILMAKQIQQSEGCTWTEALRVAHSIEEHDEDGDAPAPSC